MKLIRIDNKRTSGEFLDTARILYRGDKNWICPPDWIIYSVFDPNKNSHFESGGAERWILKDSAGSLIGRVAAFYHEGMNSENLIRKGGIGFFECIRNHEASSALFDACADWLNSNGIAVMEGPVNFGYNDNFWGLLVEGFTPPGFGMNYNPPWYRELFEAYGFESIYVQETKHLDLTRPFPDRFWKIAKWVLNKPDFSYEHYHKNRLDKFAGDITEVYNSAWIDHEGYTPIEFQRVRRRLKEADSVIIEDFIWFVYYKGRPIAFLVMLPDMNQVFRFFDGKLNVWNKLRFLLLKNSKIITRSRITVMGVVPEFQGKGIESVMFWHLQEPLLVKRPHYKEIEISWVGDFNPKMKAILDAIGAGPGKKHITFRKRL